MTYDVPVQMTVSEGFGPIPAPSSSVMIVTYEETEPIDESGLSYRCVFDKPAQEVVDAIQNGVTVLMKDKYNQHIAPVTFNGYQAIAIFSYVQTINPPAYFDNYVIRKWVDMHYSSHDPDLNAGSSYETRFPITQNVLIANATQQNIGGSDFLVLDKTFSEICNAPFAVVKYGASEWGTGHGIKASWYVYDVYEHERRVRVITMNENTPTIVTFDALSDDDYPKIAL